MRRFLMLLMLLGSCAHPGSTMRIADPSELQLRPSYDMAAAQAWKRPTSVTFEVEGVQVKGDQAVVTGWLSNASSEPQVVVIFPVGPMGLVVQPAPGRATRLPPRSDQPPRMMPAPPPPEFLTLPPQSRVRVQSGIDLTEYSWDPKQPHELEWSFQFWDEPKPRGLLPLP